MWRQLKIAVIFLVVFSIITGIIYPLFVTGIAQAFFHHQANGSLIVTSGKIEGSELIGQPFSDPKYFWGRLSATSPEPYNANSSSGSNYGPSNPALKQEIQARIEALKKVDPDNSNPIPVDLVTSSGSGLDPDISLAAAEYQVPRIARYRGLDETKIYALVDSIKRGRQFGLLGEPRVNVLELNMHLDTLK